MFSGAANIVIHNGNFSAHSVQATGEWDRERDAMRRLEEHVAFGAFHNSKERHDPPKCLPRTRTAVFQDISDWIHITSTKKPILWLYGPAGSGKSAIAQSIAEKIYEREILGCLLLATFFFNRSKGDRNNDDCFVSSLAYQMISSIPETRKFVLQAIITFPNIFSTNLRTQMQKLIIEPLVSAGVARSPCGLLIIVDGLDECQKIREREECIQALLDGVTNPSLHLIVLCHSRPESDIRAAFNRPEISELSARLVLDDQFEPDSDIQIMLDHDFAEIKRSHPLRSQLPRDWPPKHALKSLVMKSSGQFIYPSAVMKYIASRKHNPVKRLEVVLDVGSGTDASPFKELDAFYTLVLSCVEKDDHSILVRIIGMVCFQGLYGEVMVNPRLIDDVLSLESGRTLLILDDLHSLIDVGDSGDELKPYHASFGDFLEDRSRSNEYYVDHAAAVADCALAYFKTSLYTLIDAPIQHEWIDASEALFESGFRCELTEELEEFFKSLPWKCLLKNGLPNPVPSIESLSSMDFWVGNIHESYEFCRKASDTSSTWALIFKRALTEIAGWLADYLHRLSLLADSGTICLFQNRLRSFYILSLLDTLHSCHDWGLWHLIIDIFETSGLPCIKPINKQQRNSAIFDAILEGLVTGTFVGCVHNPDECLLSNCKTCSNNFVQLLNLADRTSFIDSLLPYLEDEIPILGHFQDKAAAENMAKVKRCIATYREKPIPDGYDHDFQLESSVRTLRKRYWQVCQARTHQGDENSIF